MTAEEWAGLAFALLQLSLTEKGKNLLEMRFSHTYDEYVFESEDLMNEEQFLKDTTLNHFIKLLEMMLSFHAWYKQENFWPTDDEDVANEHAQIAQDSIRKMLRTIKRRVPRMSGNKYKLQKFHEILHLVEDIKNLGHQGIGTLEP